MFFKVTPYFLIFTFSYSDYLLMGYSHPNRKFLKCCKSNFPIILYGVPTITHYRNRISNIT